MPAVGHGRPGGRVVDAPDPPRRVRRLHALRPVPGEPRHLVEPAHEPPQAAGRDRAPRAAPVPAAPTAPRVRPHRPRPLTPAGHRRARRVGQRTPRAQRAQHGAGRRSNRCRGRTRRGRSRDRAARRWSRLRLHCRTRGQQAVRRPLLAPAAAGVAMTFGRRASHDSVEQPAILEGVIMVSLEPAAARLGALVRGVRDDQLATPTPCPGYTLGDLLDHVGGLALAFRDAATKATDGANTHAPSGDAARLPDDWRDRIPADLNDLAEAWGEAGAWEGTTRIAGAEMPAAVV